MRIKSSYTTSSRKIINLIPKLKSLNNRVKLQQHMRGLDELAEVGGNEEIATYLPPSSSLIGLSIGWVITRRAPLPGSSHSLYNRG